MGQTMRRFRAIQVLIVEDNPDDVEITRRAFRKSQMASELLVARDGQEVIDLLVEGRPDPGMARTPRPDLVLLDINLPKVNGLEVLERIRASERLAAIPVVMLSASDRDEDVLRSYRLGANSYIQKPVSFDRFLETLTVLAEYWFEVATLPRAA